jgi:hypothetical protein
VVVSAVCKFCRVVGKFPDCRVCQCCRGGAWFLDGEIDELTCASHGLILRYLKGRRFLLKLSSCMF